jgi:lipopolysaccharide export system permease protein
MIFKQALQRELSRTFTATLVVLVTIVMTMMLIRTLGLASKGSVNPQEVFLVMAYSVLGHIPTILTLSLFISLVSTLSRMMRDSEMVIWLSSGQSLLGFLKPLFSFSVPLLITISVMALLVWPWTNSQMQDLRTRFEQRGDLERITPGQFQESSNGKRVFYIDKASEPDGDVKGDVKVQSLPRSVFIATFDGTKEVVTSARNGRIEQIGGIPYLLLDAGQRLERDTATGAIKLTRFETLGANVQASALAQDARQPKAMSSYALLTEGKPEHWGELAWRMSLALAAINLIVLALALSSVNARSGKSGNLMIAVFAFIIYYNMMNVAQAWISSNQIGFLPAMLALHGTVLAAGCTLLLRRTLKP